MLSELWNIFKADFKKRITICSILVISTTFFDVFVHPLMKFIWILAFLVSVELFAYIYTRRFLSQFWLILTHRRAVRISIPIEISDLTKRIGVKIKELRIREGLYNAYVIGKSLVLGRELLEKLSDNECLAVVAHELGHIKEKHSLIRFLSIVPVLVTSCYNWLDLPPVMFLTASLAYVMVAMTPINWDLEYRADRFAAKFAGTENIISALHVLARKENPNEPSEDHPPISKRVKRLEAASLNS